MSTENKPQHYKKKEITNSMIFRRTGVMVSGAALIASIILIASSCNAEEPAPEQEVPGFTVPVTVSETTVTETEAPLVLLPEAEERLEKCKDSAGWITIDGVVDEEVVQYTDNKFYLERGQDGNPVEGGTIFADWRNILAGSKTSDNIILYGHNMKNNTRFGQLDFYKWNKNYYKQKPVITFNTNYENAKYKIFAIFVTNTEPEDDNGVVFDYQNYIIFDEARYNDFIENCMKRSTILTGVDTQFGDKFLTLSTCSTEFDNSRLVIVARKLRDGESEEVDMTNFKINPNPMYPATYYKYMGGSYIEE